MGDKFKSLKKFLSKQITSSKFLRAGAGRRLDDESSTEGESSGETINSSRSQPSDDALRAGQAALDRLSVNQTASKRSVPTTSQQSSVNCGMSRSERGTFGNNRQVYFQCPEIGSEVLPRNEWLQKIKDYLEQLGKSDRTNPEYVAILIKSVNSPARAKYACDKLVKCLQNILDYPTEEKYKKIKASNPQFRDKLLPIYGCEKFLLMSGFNYVIVDDTKYLVFQPDDYLDILKNNIEVLIQAEPIQLILDRNPSVVKSPTGTETESDDFFQLTRAEIKQEADRRRDELEELQILKCRTMKEKSSSVEYALIRIKFPDGLHLQGTFKVTESIKDIKTFVWDHLKTKSTAFELLSGIKRKVLDPERTLVEENLTPTAILFFEWHKGINANHYGFLSDTIISLSC